MAALLMVTGACGQSDSGAGLPIVSANDNRTAAGVRRGDTLVLALEVRMARWYPEKDGGPFVDAPVFAEVGKAPQVPGPLIRVAAGTTVRATVRNALADSTLKVVGLESRPVDSLTPFTLKPGESREVTFSAGEPGTYMYGGVVGNMDYDKREREQLAGAFVVDSSDAPVNDRVLVINIYGEPVDSQTYRNALAINGKSWPYNERISATVGDTVRWRVVNATVRPHPMHLHGFYFRIDRRGGIKRDTLLSPDNRRLEVTEEMNPMGTMSMSWSPDRDGQWLFHCHIGFHVIPDTRLEPPAAHDRHDALSQDPGDHMAGLVLGINVTAPPGWTADARVNTTAMRLLIQEGPKRTRSNRRMGFVLQDGASEPARDSVNVPGPVLVMHRGQPVDVTVVNHLKEPSAVHWHGVELESYSDGVAGWSGNPGKVAPMIAPGDSFTARLTLKRAGTFIYHTHLGDFEQLSSGMYGGIVVLEPGQRMDPATDHLYVAGWDSGDDPQILVNGDSVGGPAEFRAGVTHRLRFINIGLAEAINVRLLRDTIPVPWTAVATDGAEYTPRQRRTGPATFTMDVGRTADFEFKPERSGDYLLKIWVGPPEKAYQVRIRVQ